MKNFNRKIIKIFKVFSFITILPFSAHAMKDESFIKTKKTEEIKDFSADLKVNYKKELTLNECMNLYCTMIEFLKKNNIDSDVNMLRTRIFSPIIGYGPDMWLLCGKLELNTSKKEIGNLVKALKNTNFNDINIQEKTFNILKYEVENHYKKFLEETAKIIKSMEKLNNGDDEDKLIYIIGKKKALIYKNYYNNKDKIEKELKNLKDKTLKKSDIKEIENDLKRDQKIERNIKELLKSIVNLQFKDIKDLHKNAEIKKA